MFIKVNIIQLEISAAAQRLQQRGIQLSCTPEALALLLEKGFEPEYGARPLRRAVERYLEDPLAEELLKGAIPDNSVVEVVADGQNLRFALQSTAAKPPRRSRRKKSEHI